VVVVLLEVEVVVVVVVVLLLVRSRFTLAPSSSSLASHQVDHKDFFVAQATSLNLAQ